MAVHHSGGVRPAPDVGRTTGGVRRLAAAGVLTAVAAVSALVASCAGLSLEDPYPGAASTVAMLRGYDLVNVPVAVAVLAVIRPARRGSAPAVLVQASLLAYLIYTYAYYLFGTGFNDLFLLHVAVFTASLVALGATLPAIDLHDESAPVGRAGSRAAAALLGVLAVALGGMWMAFAIDNAVTGDVPAGSRLVETDGIVHLGMALDLALLVPWYATAAVLVWRHRGAGYPAAVIALVAGLLHQVSYIVALPVQVAADVPGATAVDPGEPVIVFLYATALALLVTGRRRPRAPGHTGN